MIARASELERLQKETLLEKALSVPLQSVNWPAMTKMGIEVIVRRDDLIHRTLSGNKFYKLFFNLRQAMAEKQHRILSFGGAYSNHLHALAAAGKEYGLQTIGVVRGHRPKQLSPTLADAQAWGMELHFVSRQEYQRRNQADYIEALRQRLGDFYAVPEGGANLQGARGCQVIAQATATQLDFDGICLACGTGTTLAGVAAALEAGKTAYGFSVLKGEGQLAEEVAQLQRALTQVDTPQRANWQLIEGYHGGGYARYPEPLQAFVRRFEDDSGIPLDPVYTAKLFWGMEAEAQKGLWPRGTRLVAVHSGGLQGRRGYPLHFLQSHFSDEHSG